MTTKETPADSEPLKWRDDLIKLQLQQNKDKEAEINRLRGLLQGAGDALCFYAQRSGKTKEIRGRIIEFDPDAGPLYERTQMPLCDEGEAAEAALAGEK